MAMAMAMAMSSPYINTTGMHSSLPKFRTPTCCLSLPGISLKSSFTGGRIPLSQTNLAVQTLKHGRMQICCQGSGIPAEYQWLKESIEKIGPDIFKKTYYPKAADHENAKKKWYIVDASDKVLGRLASTIAIHIRGKNLATYTPSVDMGAYVIVVNAEKVAVSGKKRQQKLYRRHSGRPGGLKVETFDQLQRRIPERIIEHAVRGMLPKGRLGRQLFTHLKVFKGPDHIHEAQRPEPLPIMDKRIMLKK